ncbi:unnamed protein product, partial [Larinioides sclopetarius]
PLELYTSWRSIWGIRPPEIHTILRRSADLSSQVSAWEDSLSDWTPLTVRSRLVSLCPLSFSESPFMPSQKVSSPRS